MISKAKKILEEILKKEKARDGYVCIYKCSKLFCTSTYEHACTAKETNTSKMKEIVDINKYEIEEIYAINQ